MMSKNKFLLPIIILLLILTLPFGIYGLVLNLQEAHKSANPNHLHKFNGSLYYYEGNKELGHYTCEYDDCDDPEVITEDEYLYIVRDENDVVNSTIGSVAGNYAFVKENNEIRIRSLLNGKTIRQVYSIKNYGISNLPFIIIGIEDGKYTALSSASLTPVIPDYYDYVGYLNNELTSDTFAVKYQGKYYLIKTNADGEEDAVSFKSDNPIYYYTDRLIFVKKGNNYQVYNYEGELKQDNIIKLEFDTGIIYATDSDNKQNMYIYLDMGAEVAPNEDGEEV